MNHRQSKARNGKARTQRRTTASIPMMSTIKRLIPAMTILAFAPSSALAAGGLVLLPDYPMLVTLIILFTLLIMPMNKLIFQPVFRVLDERAAKISGARNRALQLESEADSTMNRYRDAIRGAREGAETARQSQLKETRSEQGALTSDAKAEATAEIARARGEIEASLNDARESLRASSQEIAKIAAEQILGRNLT